MLKNTHTWHNYQDVIDTINQYKSKKITNKVLHGHPSPLFWNHEINFDVFMLQRKQNSNSWSKKLILYIALPFCIPTNPANCGYCLFPHVDYTCKQELKNYLKYLKKEGSLYRDYLANDKISAVYFGGGTPNLYPEEFYDEIMNVWEEQFPKMNQNIEITFEGIPALFTRKKLVDLKKRGITRISMGVQQLSPELIKLSGRKQDPSHVIKVINWCHELDLKVSADMIYGWPRQTISSMLNDLDILVKAKIPHITNYELNLGGRTDFSRNRRHEIPTNEENLIMFLTLKQFLEDNNYRQVSTNDFVRIAKNDSNIFRFEKYMREFWNVNEEFIGYDMWGLGYGAISYFFGTPEKPGAVFMNTTNLSNYYSSIDMNRPPIKRAFSYSKVDLKLGWIFQSLQSLMLNRKAYLKLFKKDAYDDYKLIWQAIEKMGWAEISDKDIKLLGEGIYYTPLIQTLISSNRIQEIRKEQKH